MPEISRIRARPLGPVPTQSCFISSNVASAALCRPSASPAPAPSAWPSDVEDPQVGFRIRPRGLVTARVTRFTRRSVLVKQPSFSAQTLTRGSRRGRSWQASTSSVGCPAPRRIPAFPGFCGFVPVLGMEVMGLVADQPQGLYLTRLDGREDIGHETGRACFRKEHRDPPPRTSPISSRCVRVLQLP